MVTAEGVGRVVSVVFDCREGTITCLCSPVGPEQTFGRCWVHRQLTKDEAVYLRSRLMGQPWCNVQQVIASALCLPLGYYIRCKLPA